MEGKKTREKDEDFNFSVKGEITLEVKTTLTDWLKTGLQKCQNHFYDYSRVQLY